MRQPITAAIIARDDMLLRKAVESVREHVDEVLVVDTGSAPEVLGEYRKLQAEGLVDRLEVYTGCNVQDPTSPHFGKILNFAKARQRSFELARNKWVLWVDADDQIQGAEHFEKILARGAQLQRERNQAVGFIFPYQYAYDDQGRCVCIHYRERLVSDPSKFRWTNWCHEVLVPVDTNSVSYEGCEDVVWKHQRQYGTKVPESGRNLRIMEAQVAAEGDEDARLLYYLGTELSNVGRHDEAIAVLSKYVQKSGWDDEKCMACLRLTATHLAFGRHEEALSWAYRAVHQRETWAEGYFAVARVLYHLAMGGVGGVVNVRRNWERCVYFAKLGLSLPPTRTLLFVNPLERAHEIHVFLNIALNSLGDVRGALESARLGLQGNPADTNLAHNAKLFERHLARVAVDEACGKLRDIGELEPAGFDLVHAIVHKQMPSPQLQAPPTDPIAGLFQTEGETVRPAELVPSGAKLIIAFACDGAWEPWNPKIIAEKGMGGSETAVAEVSKRLAARGHNVRVFANCGEEGIYDGVLWSSVQKMGDIKNPDILVAWRYAPLLQFPAKAKLLWVHDVFAGQANHSLMLEADRVLGLSAWHCDFLKNHHKLHVAQLYQTRNGIDLSRFDVSGAVRNPHRVVCSSSFDRYLPAMVGIWPLVRRAVPDAELRLFYGFKLWRDMATQRQDHGQLQLIADLEAKLESMKSDGVLVLGRVDQKALAREFLSAGVWAYPTWFTETNCISAQEAQAAGLRMVTSPIAALNETAGERAEMVLGDWLSEGYQRDFADRVVKAMLAPEGSMDPKMDRARNIAYAREHFSWDGVADDWEKLFATVLDEAERGVVPPYVRAA
jgi:glycosyltransferase involved in cell wall biosynthesis